MVQGVTAKWSTPMWSILADLFIGLFEFVADVFLFRRLRRTHGRQGRSVTEDTLEVARFDFVTLVLIALVSAALMLVLSFGFGVPAGWSVGIGITVGAIWGVWRYRQLVHE
jgi:phosphate/sulfate permease